MTVSAGAFDPVRAVVYKQIESLEHNEPILTPVEHCKRHIRFVRESWGSEGVIYHNTQSIGETRIRMRSDQKTKTIDPTMEIHHRNVVYEITRINPVPNTEYDEIEFTCKYKSTSTILTS